MKRVTFILCLLCTSCTHYPKPPLRKLPHLRLIIPATTNLTLVWDNCGTDVRVMYGTNSGQYQVTNIVPAGMTNLTITLIKGVQYYFVSSTNCSTLGPEFLFPPLLPPLYYRIYTQTSAAPAGPFADMDTNQFERFTSNVPKLFFRQRIAVSLTP